MSGAITYEESGTDTGRRHRHNGYSSGFSPAQSQWRDDGWETRPIGDTRMSGVSQALRG